MTVTSTASATSFTLDVDQLAAQQSVSSPQLTTGAALGAGTLTLRLGTWSGAGTSFTAASGSADVAISIGATDTVAAIASKINSAGAGVVATAFNDGTHDRLLLRAKDTGGAAGFRLQSADPALASLVFDPENSPGSGMAGAGIPVQYGSDAKVRINGLAVTSGSNTMTGNIPGVTIKLAATTTSDYGLGTEVRSPVTLAIGEDVTPAVKNVSDFVAAYNALNKNLTELTKYDAATKTAGLFQGDSTVVGLQNVLRSIAGSSSLGASSQRLSDMGLQAQKDGSLVIDTAKLTVSANNGTVLQQLFTTNNNDPATNGFALKFKALGTAFLNSGGAVSTKSTVLQATLDRNTQEQTKVTDRATSVEARLKRQYTALDGQMGSLSAINAYVTQQITLWNKNTA
jgi:flagellar hook-associated protein 2